MNTQDESGKEPKDHASETKPPMEPIKSHSLISPQRVKEIAALIGLQMFLGRNITIGGNRDDSEHVLNKIRKYNFNESEIEDFLKKVIIPLCVFCTFHGRNVPHQKIIAEVYGGTLPIRDEWLKIIALDTNPIRDASVEAVRRRHGKTGVPFSELLEFNTHHLFPLHLRLASQATEMTRNELLRQCG